MEMEEFSFKPFRMERVSPSETGAWPRSRSGHRVACTSSFLLVFGGYNPDPPSEGASAANAADDAHWSLRQPVFKELWTFCFATRVWKLHKAHQDFPDELASSALALFGHILFVFGGTGWPFGYRCSNKVYCVDTRELAGGVEGARGLRLLSTSGQRPPPQYGQAVARLGDALYALGGTNGYLYNCDVHRLDLRTLRWASAWKCRGDRSEGPEGRYRHEAVALGRRIFLVAGGTADWAPDLRSLPVFDADARAWGSAATRGHTEPDGRVLFPAPRICQSAVQIPSDTGVQVFVAGGSCGQSLFADVWRLSLPELRWARMERSALPRAVFFHASAVTPEGCMYTFGGIDSARGDSRRTDELFKLWLRVPALSEMCWEAVLHYWPPREGDAPRLLRCGVPERFVRRIAF